MLSLIYSSVKELAHLVPTANGVDLSALGYQGHGRFQCLFDCTIHSRGGHCINLSGEVFSSFSSVIQALCSLFKSLPAAREFAAKPGLQNSLCKINFGFGNSSKGVQSCGSNVDDVIDLHYYWNTWEAEPASLIPNSPESVKLLEKD